MSNVDRNGWSRNDYLILLRTCERGQMRPEHLLAVMAAESELNAKAQNKDTKAAGLTQMMPQTLRNLGWLPGRPDFNAAAGEFTNAPVGIQITYAGRYFDEWRKRFGLARWDNRVQLYLCNILPAYVVKANDPTATLVERVRWPEFFRVNGGLDYNRDGRLTVDEIDRFVREATTGRAAAQYRTALAGMNSVLADQGFVPIPADTTPIPPNFRDVRDIKMIQSALVTLGFELPVDGVYGPTTRKAVMAYQQQKGLEADGWVGPVTWASMSDALQA